MVPELALRLPLALVATAVALVVAHRHGRLWAACLALGAAWLGLSALVVGWRGPLGGLDAAGQAWATTLGPGAVRAFRALTHVGNAGAVWALSIGGALALVVARRRREALAFALASAGANAWMGAWKASLVRVRPENVWAEPGWSFPSGHATAAAVLAGALAVGLWQRGTRAARLGALAVALVGGALGLSRVALGVHYATDVLGGWLLGLLWLVAAGVPQAFRRAEASGGGPAAGPVDTAPRSA